MDELRDYVYYKKDMVHLKDYAVEYILKVFNEVYFKSNLREYINIFNKIKKSLNHKILNPLSKENFKMLKDISEKIIELEKTKKNDLIDKQKKKLMIKIINNFSDKKNEMEAILDKFFYKDKNTYNFFKIILEENYNELIKLDINEYILVKYRDKVLLNNLLKKT